MTGAGYLSVYLSEPLARYPIRHVTRPADNKNDPNIETGTFGLFSTCEQQMRAKIVREGRSYLFFATKYREKGRSSSEARSAHTRKLSQHMQPLTKAGSRC